jgi:hypothetical protein
VEGHTLAGPVSEVGGVVSEFSYEGWSRLLLTYDRQHQVVLWLDGESWSELPNGLLDPAVFRSTVCWGGVDTKDKPEGRRLVVTDHGYEFSGLYDGGQVHGFVVR